MGASLHAATLPNARWHFPETMQQVAGRGGYQTIFKPFSSSNLQNWIFFHDRRSFTDFSALYTVLKLEKVVSGVLEQ